MSARGDARQKLHDAANAIATAALVLQSEEPTMAQYLEEARHMDSFGPILDPTLFRDPERRAADALMRPLVQAAIDFLLAYNTHTARAKAALAKVSS